MTGEVDSLGRALVSLRVRREQHAEDHALTAWVDTGFTGELVVPRKLIEKLNFAPSTSVTAELADGKQVLLDTFCCFVEWFSEQKIVEVIESEKGLPLLGVGLLAGHRLSVDYEANTLTIE